MTASTSTATATATLLVNGTSTTLLPTVSSISGLAHLNSSATPHSNSTVVATASLRSSSSVSRALAPSASAVLPNAGVSFRDGVVGVKGVMCLVLGLVAVGFAGL